jgi:hypothetical protein
VIREGLRSLRSVTENLVATGAFLGLLELHVVRCFSARGAACSRASLRAIGLERTRFLEGENGVTHMHYRVQR